MSEPNIPDTIELRKPPITLGASRSESSPAQQLPSGRRWWLVSLGSLVLLVVICVIAFQTAAAANSSDDDNRPEPQRLQFRLPDRQPASSKAAAATQTLITTSPLDPPKPTLIKVANWELEAAPLPAAAMKLEPLPETAPLGWTMVAVCRVLDDQGNPMVDQPVNWSLARQGVGEILAVGGRVGKKSDHSVTPQTPTFAAGRTARLTHSLSSVCPAGAELDVGPGVAWCVFKSRTPGEMVLTARAPSALQADAQEETVRIYWYDASMQVKPPTVAQVGQPGVVEVKVANSQGNPLTGHTVRCESDPATAVLSNRHSATETITDSQGVARFRVHPRDGSASAIVDVQLIGTATLAGEPTVLQSEKATLAWTEDVHRVQITAAKKHPVNQWLTVKIAVSGGGDAAESLAQVKSDQPLSAPPKLLRPPTPSDPHPPASDRTVVLTLGPGVDINVLDGQRLLGARQFIVGRVSQSGSLETEALIQSHNAGRRAILVEVRDGDRLLGREQAVIEFGQSTLQVVKSLPDNWPAQQERAYTIKVRNDGPHPVEAVQLHDEVPSFLKIVKTDGMKRADQLVWQIGTLAAGKEKTVKVQALATATATAHSTRTWVTADGLARAEAFAELNVSGRPGLRAAIRDVADPVPADGEVEYILEIENRGSGSAHNVQLSLSAPSTLTPLSSTGSLVVRVHGGRFEIAPLQELAPGEKLQARLRAKVTSPGEVRLQLNIQHPSTGQTGLRVQESTLVYGSPRTQTTVTTRPIPPPPILSP